MLFEVEVLYSTNMTKQTIKPDDKQRYLLELNKLLLNPEFKMSIESTTKSIERYNIRFKLYEEMFSSIFTESVSFKNPISIKL